MFATGPSINIRILVAVLLSIALLVIDQRSSRLANLRAGLSFIVYPIMYAVDLPSEFISQLSESAITYSELRAENKRLKEQQFISDSKLLKFAALEKENIRLRSLLDSSYKIGEQMLVAEILSVNFAPFDHVVLVNKGSRFGIHDMQPVFDTQGVVGQVVRTLPLSSEIMLITDPNHAIPVQVNRNGLRTIAMGSGQLNQLILPFLPNNADIKPGDLLITSGLGGVFPQGYPVAVVNSFEVQPHKPFALVLATPKAALDKIREVLIVWSDSKSVPLNMLPFSNGAASKTPASSLAESKGTNESSAVENGADETTPKPQKKRGLLKKKLTVTTTPEKIQANNENAIDAQNLSANTQNALHPKIKTKAKLAEIAKAKAMIRAQKNQAKDDEGE